ncbi:MAG: hypothetical protein IT445_08120 [Phycisphaeraceae bacterium]|nr:hypothetical protein [Phycisphaeraceae bacterium]
MPQFISEPITPAPGSFDAAAMARGEPGLPSRFTWRNLEHHVTDVLQTWTTSSPEGGSGEMYLRRHWWLLRTDRGQTMKIYCERHPRHPQNKQRWFVYTLEEE